MTAQRESRLTAISEKKANYIRFLEPLISTITEMVSEAGHQSFSGLPKVVFNSKKTRETNNKFTRKSAFKKSG